MSVVASTYLLVLLRFNPRIFLGHYPKEIRESVPLKSEKERRMSILFGLLIGAPGNSGTGNEFRGSTIGISGASVAAKFGASTRRFRRK